MAIRAANALSLSSPACCCAERPGGRSATTSEFFFVVKSSRSKQTIHHAVEDECPAAGRVDGPGRTPEVRLVRLFDMRVAVESREGV